MYAHYFYWQFVSGPRWLLTLYWHLQQAIIRFFSVPLMLRTLVAHWHRDRVSYQQGSMSGMLQALALNTISRSIGLLIRLTVLVLWLAVEGVFLVSAALVLLSFLVWPLLTLILFATGLALL